MSQGVTSGVCELPLVSVSGIDILQEKRKIIKHFLNN